MNKKLNYSNPCSRIFWSFGWWCLFFDSTLVKNFFFDFSKNRSNSGKNGKKILRALLCIVGRGLPA